MDNSQTTEDRSAKPSRPRTVFDGFRRPAPPPPESGEAAPPNRPLAEKPLTRSAGWAAVDQVVDGVWVKLVEGVLALLAIKDGSPTADNRTPADPAEQPSRPLTVSDRIRPPAPSPGEGTEEQTQDVPSQTDEGTNHLQTAARLAGSLMKMIYYGTLLLVLLFILLMVWWSRQSG